MVGRRTMLMPWVLACVGLWVLMEWLGPPRSIPYTPPPRRPSRRLKLVALNGRRFDVPENYEQ